MLAKSMGYWKHTVAPTYLTLTKQRELTRLRHHLPPDVEALFTKQPPIKDVLELAVGEKGAYFVSFRDHDDQILCRHYNLPNPLTEYLYQSHPQVVRDLSTLSITLGPYESYYAHDKATASWSNLPAPLEKALLSRLESQSIWQTVWKQQGRDAPCFVSLGADGSYFMRTVAGGGSWDLKSKAEGMTGTNKFLEGARDFTGVAGLYLFPQYPDCYVLLLMSGKTFSNLPEHTWPDYNKMAPALQPLVQTLAPIPAVPAPQVQLVSSTLHLQPVSRPQSFQNPTGSVPLRTTVTPQFVQHNCCPPAPAGENCCPPAPQQSYNPTLLGSGYRV
ncbi:hypothetical protein M011DRAFT_472876 [Sporormia fimetaria CBS 119925]|uniref:Uncharacterized protein n=1 Tax=Sporormia fimetaria CBS 119925 TaxID=1340428 RepID=A0A6A6UTL5_9PLEO|nr:hypothetical protein M011DRAFT_472876 [Sporormia fimetaria CBS 119925]